MSSPARTSVPSSLRPAPARKALNERTTSETNVPPSPTIRIVDEPDDTVVYARSPFPSHPSQVLPPHQKPGYAFQDRGSDLPPVSDENTIIAQHPKSLVPSPLQPRKPNRQSYSTTSSSTDSRHERRSISGTASSYTPDSSRLSQATYNTPPSSPGVSENEDELPSFSHIVKEEPSCSTIRAVIPSSPPEASPLTNKSSESSLASTASDGTVAIRRTIDSQGSSPQGTPLAFQKTPQGSKALQHGASPSSSSPNWYATQLSSPQSLDSVVNSPTSHRPLRHQQSSSSEASSAQSVVRHPVNEDDTQIQYPTVHPPSSSSSWAESSSPPPGLPIILPLDSPEMSNRNSRPYQWSPRLSIIASESGRSSFSLSQPESAQMWSPSPRRHRKNTTGSESDSSSDEPLELPPSVLQPPPPLFHPGPTRVYRHLPENIESDEQGDVLHELQAPPLRHKRSGYQTRSAWENRPSSGRSSRRSSSRPGSVQSQAPSEQSSVSLNFAQSFPSWARRYYSLGERANLFFFNSPSELSLRSRMGTAASNRPFSNENDMRLYSDPRLNSSYSLNSGPSGSPLSATFPYSFSIFHPRRRPKLIPKRSSKRKGKQRDTAPSLGGYASSLSDSDLYVHGGRQRHVSEQFVPRLGKDRRTMNRMSRWTAPSLDEKMSPAFSPMNRQITLFCIGFIMPLAWMVAAVLRLPEKPMITYAAMQQISLHDPEAAMNFTFDPVAWKHYNKARWWRNLNRVMSAIGLLIIGAVITLAILSTKFRA